MKTIQNLIWFPVCALFLVSQALTAQEAQIIVDASKILNKISPLIYGSCMEDVNHEIYGGLYDQKIFGESFEEPAAGMLFENFSRYEGSWALDGNSLTVASHPGAKMISDLSLADNGSIEADIMFTGVVGDNAGLIFRVSNAGNGADNFEGYEISLSQNGKKVILGKHRFNWTALKEADIAFDRYQWTHIKVQMEGACILVFVNRNEKPVIDFTDNNEPLLSGKAGVRTWNADAAFQNLQIENGKDVFKIPFKGKEMPMVSAMWDAINTNHIIAKYTLDTSSTFNGKSSQLIEYIRGTGKLGIANRSLNRWGIAVKEGQTFQGRLYLRSKDLKGKVTIALQNVDGTKTYASQTIAKVTGNWEKHPFTLKSSSVDTNARFAVWMETPGKLWIDQVVLMQTREGQFKGLPYRADIGNAMVAEGLTFLRYGGTMVNAPGYRFKKMIGDPDRRPPYKGHWNNCSTNGFGIEDFLKFSEAAGFTPAFAINIEETASDAADMVEYLNGNPSSVWGAKRAANGHPQPYNVKYIEIGNEEVIFDGDDKNGYLHYCDRFEDLYRTIHAKDTSVNLIISAWWRPGSPNMKLVFDRLSEKAGYWDFHPWADDANAGIKTDNDLTEMQRYFLSWNPHSTMKCAIFEENGGLHSMQRALGHATTLNAVRRHSEFLLTSSPANALQPFKQNDNGWDQGQIFFTPSAVWGMPPYYAQQMASKNHLPLRVSDITTSELDVTATCSEDGNTLVLHVVNYKGAEINTSVQLQNFLHKVPFMSTWTLAGPLNEENSPSEPVKITPVETTETIPGNSFNYCFPAYSYTILRFGNKTKN